MANLQVTETLRLVSYTGLRNVSLWWYRDARLVHQVVGRWKMYQKEDVLKMYAWQQARGALYYLEKQNANGWQTIGDVWVAERDFAIVLDPLFQRKGIAKLVVNYCLDRAKKEGKTAFYVSQVYAWNTYSQHLFRALGFTETKNSLGFSYRYTFA